LELTIIAEKLPYPYLTTSSCLGAILKSVKVFYSWKDLIFSASVLLFSD